MLRIKTVSHFVVFKKKKCNLISLLVIDQDRPKKIERYQRLYLLQWTVYVNSREKRDDTGDFFDRVKSSLISLLLSSSSSSFASLTNTMMAFLCLVLYHHPLHPLLLEDDDDDASDPSSQVIVRRAIDSVEGRNATSVFLPMSTLDVSSSECVCITYISHPGAKVVREEGDTIH